MIRNIMNLIKMKKKKFYEDHKDEFKEKRKMYYDTHKEKIKKYYVTHKEELDEKSKKYYETHKDEYNERSKKYSKYSHYFRKNYFRFITLRNYLTIMKLEDVLLKRSIMTKLGLGTIDQDEAIMLSGMIFTEEDEKEMNEWYKTCRCNSTLS